VVSPADARGLMQVIPATGALVARRLGLAYDPAMLTEDPALNLRLGAEYLAELTAEFGAVSLVAAGYNAGPGRPRAWITQFGDPRDPRVDVVDWVEAIPFAETRNYVMRVIESLVVYRALLGGPADRIGVEALLRGR
jgi:soluble lytic murein transglycosylase